MLCHHGKSHHPPTGLRPGDVVTGSDGQQWAYTGETEDRRAAVFKVHEQQNQGWIRPTAASLLPALPAPAPVAASLNLARLPEPAAEPPARWPDGTRLLYSATQLVTAYRKGNEKSYPPSHRLGDGSWTKGKGKDDWPLWREEEAIEHGRGQWIAEAEGEKCAEWLRAGGLVAVSQTGHLHTAAAVEARYRRLQGAGIAGVAYLADNDEGGRRKANTCAAAARAAGLPFVAIHADEVWAGLPDKGSIDDAPGTAAERVLDFERAAKAASSAESGASGIEESAGTGARRSNRRLGYVELLPIVEAGYDLTHDTLLDRPAMDGKPLSAEEIQLFAVRLAQDHAVNTSGREAADALRYVARNSPINPVREYLKSLASERDLQPLTRQEIGVAFGLDPEDHSSHELLARQLVGCVLRGLKPGYKHDTMLILQGGQGDYKTEAIKALAPRSSWVATTTEIKETEDWKFLLKVDQCWLFLIDECDKFLRGKESATLKSVVTTTHDTYAKKGHNEADEHPRPSIMFGTTNEQELFNDATGVRRWWICPLGQGCRANPKWIAENRDRIWATAYSWAGALPRLENFLPRGSDIEAAANERAWQASFSTPYAPALHRVLNGLPVGPGAAPGIAQEDLIRMALDTDISKLRTASRRSELDLTHDVSRTVTAGGFTTHGGRIRWIKGRQRLGRPHQVAAYLWQEVQVPAPQSGGEDEQPRVALDPEVEQLLQLAPLQRAEGVDSGKPTAAQAITEGKTKVSQPRVNGLTRANRLRHRRLQGGESMSQPFKEVPWGKGSEEKEISPPTRIRQFPEKVDSLTRSPEIFSAAMDLTESTPRLRLAHLDSVLAQNTEKGELRVGPVGDEQPELLDLAAYSGGAIGSGFDVLADDEDDPHWPPRSA